MTSSTMRLLVGIGLTLLLSVLATNGPTRAQEVHYKPEANWLQTPPGKTWGMGTAVAVAPDGFVYVMDRCSAVQFTDTCTKSSEAPLHKYDRKGKFITRWGAGMFVWPHFISVDRFGFVWVADGKAEAGKGQQVHKFTSDGKLVMSLGTAGVTGDDEKTFDSPNQVAVAANGDIFVSVGHFAQSARTGSEKNLPDAKTRVVKFSKDGKFIKQWGRTGFGPGDFNLPGGPHSMAMDSAGRLFVTDPYRIQLFDQEGGLITEYRQFGWPLSIYIDQKDMLYAMTANPQNNPYAKPRGVHIGRAKDGTATAFVALEGGHGGESIAVDADGNLYLAGRGVVKYVKQQGGTK